MKIRLAVIALALAVLPGVALAASKSTATFRNIVASASDIVLMAGNSRVVLSGGAHIKTVDKVAKTTFEADANKIVVDFFTGRGGASGLGAVKSATMDGPVKMVYIDIDPAGNTTKTVATADRATYDGTSAMAYLTGNVKIVSDNPALFEELAVMTGNTTKTVATADRATYDGASGMAYLTGNVKIVSDNPAIFEEPATMTGEKASVNLNPNLGPDDVRFRVETPGGVSRIEVAPKPKTEQK